jgi:hypothetical protein
MISTGIGVVVLGPEQALSETETKSGAMNEPDCRFILSPQGLRGLTPGFSRGGS